MFIQTQLLFRLFKYCLLSVRAIFQGLIPAAVVRLFKFGIYHELFWTLGIEKLKSLNVNANVHLLLGRFNAIPSREFWQHEQNPYQNSLGLWLHSFTDTPKGCRVWIGCTYHTVCSGTCERQGRRCLPTGSGSPRESLRFFSCFPFWEKKKVRAVTSIWVERNGSSDCHPLSAN